MKIKYVIGVLLTLFVSKNVLAADEILTIESTISGSQEQPKILVIVPWKKPEGAATIANTEEKAEENPFMQPLERKGFLRKNQMLETLTQKAP